MAQIKVLKKRGARVAIEAHGEVLSLPGQPLSVWTSWLSNQISAFTRKSAPRNSRPYWGHYAGEKRLRESITTTTTGAGGYDPITKTLQATVGSSSHYALFVDQGTGVYAGRGPYEAKILPPWKRGSPSLYESTWQPPGRKHPVNTVEIRGQRGQGFFSKGIKMGMMSMGVVPFTVPGDPYAHLERSNRSHIPGAAAPQMPLFRLQLEEWRIWRDEAWGKKQTLGLDGGAGKAHAQKRAELAAQKAYRKAQRAARAKPYRNFAPTKVKKPAKPKKPKKMTSAEKHKIATAIAEQWRKAGRQFRGLTINDDGTWTALIKQGAIFKPAKGRWRPE